MVNLTEQERISLLMMRGWGDRERSYEEVVHLFNDTFHVGQTQIHNSTVSRTINRFLETSTNKDRPKSGRPKTQTTEDRQGEVAQSFIENRRLSINKASQRLGMSRFSVYKNLKILKYHPYKIHLHQELNEDDLMKSHNRPQGRDDFEWRVQFSEIIMERIIQDANFLPLIIFSDEASFQLNGNVNRHNFKYWSDENPHWMLEKHTQHSQKLNQDEAPPHYNLIVRNYLDATFHNRWIGRRGTIEWPARSPDLSPLDFFFWGCLKDLVPQDLLELRQRIINTSAEILADIIHTAIENFYVRLGQCQEVNGEHFENL
ncbi:hypothetical protein NQ315_010964, partial [Exocentrus adspersus]